MIPGIQTNAKRCPFQPITKIVNASVSNLTLDDGTKAEAATLQEQKTEFGFCHKEACMAYHAKLGICLKIINVVHEVEDESGEQ